MDCSNTRAILLLEIHIVKEDIKKIKYHWEFVSTEACMKRMIETAKGLGQWNIKFTTNDWFIFCSWYSSKISAKSVIGVGDEIIGVLKTNRKVFNTMYNMMHNFPGGFYLMLNSKTVVPGDRPILTIGCKFNYREVLSFIATERGGSTKYGIPHLSKFNDQFDNASTLPVYCHQIMSKYVNEIDSHNKYRQSDLCLENYWVTQCGWLRVYAIVSLGMTIQNFRRRFFYGFKRDHFDTIIRIR